MNKTRYHLRNDPFASDVNGGAPRALTEQERRVVAELARGLSNRQIASVLALSEHTIKFHLKNVFTKLGVRSRTQVIVLTTSATPDPTPAHVAASFAPATAGGSAALAS